MTAKIKNSGSACCWVPTRVNPSAVAQAVTMMALRVACRLSAKAVTMGSTVNRVNAGTAVMMPIQDASIPTAFSHTGKNGR